MKRTVVGLSLLLWFALASVAAAAGPITCWFPPGANADNAREIVAALSAGSGAEIRPRLAKSYPEILEAFASNDQNLVYVGSFVQAIISARKIGTPLVQAVSGKENYSGILVYPKGQDPQAILSATPAEIAFAVGASSGESSAKAATGGKAAIAVPNHGAACGAVTSGKAKAAVVKNWWWESNSAKFPELESYLIPKISVNENPDNVLTASNAIDAGVRDKIAKAALDNAGAFGVESMKIFDPNRLMFPLHLMKQGGIDPLTYQF